MSYLIDTDVLIEISKGNDKAIDFLNTLGDSKISVISAMELVVGARNNTEISEIENFLSEYERLHIGEEISVKALELIKRHSLTDGMSIPDSLIAATAINRSLTLTTKNTKHFKAIKELKLKEPDY